MTTETIYNEAVFNETLGHYLGEARRRTSISDIDVAIAIGVEFEYIAQVEHFGAPLNVFQARKYADLVGVSIAPFFDNGTQKYPCTVLNLNYMITLLTHIAENTSKWLHTPCPHCTKSKE